MNYRNLIITNIFFFLSFAASSQTIDNASMTWEDFVTLMADDSDDEYGPSQELFEDLYDLHIHPMNLNTITEEDLHQLPFLSENDIKDITFYISNHRPLMSTGELMFIYSLDRQKRLMLQLFCFAGESNTKNYSLQNLLKYSQSELVIRTDIPLYTKSGYQDIPDSILAKNPNKVYIGNKLYHSLRYNISSQNHFFAGFQMEKDAGERYIDHFAGYAMIKNIGCVRSAIVGNYRISFGHGLVINTGSAFGKAMKLSSMDIIDKGISKQSSTAETGYFTGAATTLRFGKTLTSAFISNHKADGTFNNDSSGITNLKTDGLHRTPLEYSKKNNISITDFGANVHFDLNQIQLSFTAVYTHLSNPLTPVYNSPSTFYRQYNPKGTNFSAYSTAYSYRMSRLFFSGETAIDSKGSIATINQIQWTPTSCNTFTIIQRHYNAKYNAINARAFGENSSVKNESGLYLGWNTSLSEKINLNAYIDGLYFPWLKYQVYGSSYGYEGMLQATYTPTEKHSFSLRYRIKSKQKDFNLNNTNILKFKTNNNLRIQYTYNNTDNLSLRTMVSSTLVSFDKKSFGYSISQSIKYTGIKNFRLDFTAIYFNTDSYDSRIYNYESSLLYSFAMSSYYYKGIRGFLLASWKINKHISVTGKISNTTYFNQTTIGTDLEMINSRHREDCQIQLRIKL